MCALRSWRTRISLSIPNCSFSNLFGAPPLRESLAIGPGGNQTILNASRNSSPVISYHGSASTAGALASVSPSDQQQASSLIGPEALQSGFNRTGTPAGSIRSINQRLSTNSNLIVLMDSDLNVDRSRSSLKGSGSRLSAASSDMTGYIHAYGWSLPASSIKYLSSSPASPDAGSLLAGDSSQALETSVSFNKLSGLQVPIPQCCRPLTGDSLGMKIWCATAIDLSGGDLSLNPPLESATAALSSSSSSNATERTPTNQITLRSEQDFHAQVDSSGSVVNISTSTPIKSPNQNALKMLEMEVDRALQEPIDPDSIYSTEFGPQRPILKTTTEMVLNALPVADEYEDLSSCVWICSTKHSRSKITIIDIKTKPNELLDSFYVPTYLYCIKSISGCKPTDLLGITAKAVNTTEPAAQPKVSPMLQMITEMLQNQKREFYKLINVDLAAGAQLRQRIQDNQSRCSNVADEDDTQTDRKANQNISVEDDDEISRILDNNVSAGIATLQKLNDFVAHSQPADQSTTNNQPGTGDQVEQDTNYYQPISTHLPTVWMGGRNSVLYIHSAVAQWKDCVACLKLSDSILQICHFRGRVFVALADGSLCVFFRNMDNKQWDISRYLQIDINLMAEVTNENMADLLNDSSSSDPLDKFCSPSRMQIGDFLMESNVMQDNENIQNSPTSSKVTKLINDSASNTSFPSKSVRSKIAGIRCLEIANKNLWIGYRNRVLIIDPVTLKLRHSFNVVPQVDNQIRQLVAMKDGVFCCLRSDLILRLYSSLRPYQHIQNVDIEPVVSRLISPKTFVISHITAMKVARNTLWIGNAHGIILTIPCKLLPQISDNPTSSGAGDLDESVTSLSIARSVPKCDITNAQVSIHTFSIIQVCSIGLVVLKNHLTLTFSPDFISWS